MDTLEGNFFRSDIQGDGGQESGSGDVCLLSAPVCAHLCVTSVANQAEREPPSTEPATGHTALLVSFRGFILLCGGRTMQEGCKGED